uniref:Guanine nucleotide-binding protein subunit gamma 3-like n=1 Tax=Kalanchoe fedtschenkoi TaxID=63787 RepID=A0A7N0V020_KALFE
MAVLGDSSSSAAVTARAPSSLPPPTPKSPPKYPDLYGKRREAARLQTLNREIGLLQEDLKFVDGLHPASMYCKEVVDFVVSAADPLTPSDKKDHKSHRIWNWLCKLTCFDLSWLCCYHCSPQFQVPKFGCCEPCNCTRPHLEHGCSCSFHKSSCRTDCSYFVCPSCSHCFCTEWGCSVPNCAPRVFCHCNCIKKCCNLCDICCA